MKIRSCLLDELHEEISAFPPETGGILGSDYTEIITEIILDTNDHKTDFACSYSPNIQYFNECIEKWSDSGIAFMGVFHTHFANVRSLSNPDKVYIERIMKAMPEAICKLYFPIYTLPERRITAYIADKSEEGIIIYRDEVEII